MNKIYIVGAHSRGRTVAHYLRYLSPELSVEAYLVDDDEDNPVSIDGVPVIHLDKITKLNTEIPVYIGTRGVFHAKITDKLKLYGMQDIRPVTVDLDLQLRNAYLRTFYKSEGRNFVKIDDLHAIGAHVTTSANVYVAKSVFDKPLQSEYVLEAYEREIQVGAALTDRRLAEGILVDNRGENISIKNKQFCELTALYWIWNNVKEDIVGLVHYRRHFMLPSNWVQRMLENKVDVILPVPLYVAPSLEENYKSRHDASDLDYMFEFLRENYPMEVSAIKKFFANNLYSPCNMIIAKKAVLNRLCEWLFPILEAVEEHGGQKEDAYLNRYPGFLSERLISYYFEANRDSYHVVYADKNFLQ